MFSIFELVPSQLRGAQHTTPQQRLWTSDDDVDLHTADDEYLNHQPFALGDTFGPCPEEMTRVLFGNINGLQLNDQGTRLRQIFREINMLQADHTGLVEINTNTSHSGASKRLYDVARDEFTHSTLTAATSKTVCSSLYKPGGVLSITRDDMVGRVIDKGADPMGRWSFCKYAGKNKTVVTIITAYQVCRRPTNEIGNTAFHQQSLQMAQEALQQNRTIPTPQPRLRFKADLLKFLRGLRLAGESLILMGNFNEDITDLHSNLQQLFQDPTLELIDVIGRSHPQTRKLSTYIRGTTRLDFVLISRDLLPAVRQCGYLPYHSHFRTDHRFAFVDFDLKTLFGSASTKLASHAFREFSSKDPKRVEQYLLAKFKFLKDANFFRRFNILTDPNTPDASPDHELAEKLDKLWVNAGLHAAQKCKKRRQEWWSIPLHKALEEKALLQTHLSGLRTGHDMSEAIQARIAKFQLTLGPLPPTIQETSQAIKSVQSQIKTIRAASKSVREQSLIEQARDATFTGCKSDAEILEMLRKKEAQADRWKKINFVQGHHHQSQFTNVEVPSSWPTTQAEFLNPDTVIENPKQCDSWRTIEDPDEMEFYIQMRNRLHFGQAQGTPFTIGQLQQDIDWSATTPAAESVLVGRYRLTGDDYHMVDEDDVEIPQHKLIQEFLSSCQRSPLQQATPLIQPEISLEELRGRIKVWNERTTTSPSGLHLGHLKSLTARIRDPPQSDSDDRESQQAQATPSVASIQSTLLGVQLALINYGLRHGYAFNRWKQVVNVMIEKETGNHKIHRLRVIHLYEADLGATFAILWKKMFASAELNHDINDGQYGGRKGHEAAYLPYAEELKYDICRMSRKSLVNFDNDAQSCYDRIIPSVASLLGRFHGLHPQITKMHASMLQSAVFQVKTSLGVSSAQYTHSDDFPIYGTGQGSTNSPIIWSMISSKKLFDLHHQQASGASFCTPDRTICVQESAFGFVDDTTCQTNDFLESKPKSLEEIVAVATEDAKIWSTLLYISGGLLELPKCSVHVIYTTFYSDGQPRLCKHADIPPILIPDPRSGQQIDIRCNPHDKEHKTLGHYKAPSGTFPNQRAALQKAANSLASMVLHSALYPEEAKMMYYAVFLAKFAYVLPQCYFLPSALRHFEAQAQQAFAAKMGFSRTMSCAIRYGPIALGGVGMVQFESLQGIGQIQNFIKHWRSYTYIGSLLRCTLAWAQTNAGIGTSLLISPSVTVPHLESRFLQSLRLYLAEHDAKIEVDDPFIPPVQRENDQYLMEIAMSQPRFKSKDLKRINYCRLYLQVITMSDIVLPQRLGTTIDPTFITGISHHSSPTSAYCHTNQAKPSQSSWTIWYRLCEYVEEQLTLRPLGRWTVPGNALRRNWQSYYDFSTCCIFRRVEHTESFYRLFPMGDPINELFMTDDRPQEWSPSSTCVPILSYILPAESHMPTTIQVAIDGSIASYCPIAPPEFAPLFHRATSFQEYLTAQKPHIQQLFSDLDIRIPSHELLEILQATVSPVDGYYWPCLGVSDGSEYQGSMTFGWTIAAPDGFRLVACAGPAFGSQASSYRAEGYGLLSMALFLYHFRRFTESSSAWRVNFASDNLGLITKVRQSLSFDFPFPNLTLDSDYDLIHEIVMTNRQSRMVSKFSHVKGHQDSLATPFDDLPLVTQLNIEADDLAGAFRTTTLNRKYPQVPMLCHTRCLLHCNEDETITRAYKSTLRTLVSTPALHRYMLKTFHWHPSVLLLVDWTTFQRCRARLQHKHVQMTKFVFDILPTAAIVARRQPATSDICPLCKAAPETNDHIYQCPAASVSCWRSTMLHEIRKLLAHWDTRYGLVEVMMAGISSVFDPTTNDTLSLQGFPPAMHPLIRDQNAIGWRQLLHGRGCSKWAAYQQEVYTDRSEQDKKLTGTSWMTTVMCLLLTQVFDLWNQRNDFVHGTHSTANMQIRRAQVLQELKLIHSHRDDYRAGDLQFLLTEDPNYEDEKFQSVLNNDSVKQTEGWVKRMTPFFRESLQTAKQLPSAVRRTPSIRTVFRPLRSRIFNIRARPPDPPPQPRATRARARLLPTARTSIASFFTRTRSAPPPA
eukprot:scaffold7555_cov72-Cylindrotheca_fusiformis.AAC.3